MRHKLMYETTWGSHQVSPTGRWKIVEFRGKKILYIEIADPEYRIHPETAFGEAVRFESEDFLHVKTEYPIQECQNESF